MSVRKSLLWSYGGQVSNLIVSFMTSIIVARLLDPHQFGIFAYAMAIMGFLGVFTSLNLGSFLIREQSLNKEAIRSLFTLNAIEMVLLCIIILIAACVEYLVFDQSEIAIVLVVSTASPLISLFEFIPATLFQREMNFAVLSKTSVVRNIISSAATVSGAAYGLGPIALAAGPAMGSIFSVVILNSRRPRDIIVRPTRRGLKPAFIYGVQIMSISGIAQITQRLSDLLLSGLLGLSALGLYSRASNLSGLVFTNVYGQATAVVFTRMSKDLRERGSFHNTFLLSMKMITAAIWPLILGIAILSRPLIRLLYGAKWDAAAAPLFFLMIAQFVALGFGMNWEVFVLRHQTALQTRFEVIRAVCGLGLFIVACNFSIAAAAMSRVGECLIGYLLYRRYIDRFVGLESGELERLFVESLSLTMIAVAPSLVLMVMTKWSFSTSPILVLLAVSIGVGLWFGRLRQTAHPLFVELLYLRGELERKLFA